MGNEYSESTGSILAASIDRDSLVAYTENLKRGVRQGGGDFRGPDPLPVADPVDLRAFLVHIEAPNSDNTLPESALIEWLFGLADSEAIVERLVQAAIDDESLFGRKCKVVGDQSVRKAFNVERPAEVMVVGELGYIDHPKNFGHDPHTYDPNLDYFTNP